VSVKPADEVHWDWLVRYEAYPKEAALNGIPPFLHLVVQMDGTVVEPEVMATRGR
jgi:hypothetical protein